ncbi:hypothetical protein B0T22DRAFT_469074 [Podospora appendiculata]|uniref:Actin-related protein 10 n=1 Tax=Podospora appendiculata TaxID=314037 RepID=A0AAE1C968_9PEZI|nr:hypothetical protein B0T22DRAFT_469074 [Podospora appendiculata]
MRPITSTFASPSSLRAEEDIILIEFGTRKLLVGFAGDAAPRGAIWFGPEQQRRVGDFRAWQSDYHPDWRNGASGDQWGRDYELWRSDVRDLDLGLVGDKIERALRDAFTKYLLIDSRPRRIACVIPSGLSIPLLSVTLDSLFGRFQSPTVSLLSPPVSLAIGAGVRSALVIDLGWAETVVTAVYEYREVQCNRSIRGGRMLTEQTHRFLAKHLPHNQKKPETENPDESQEYVLSFEECEEITMRLAWCKPHPTSATAKPAEGLSTVEEHDESDDRRPSSATEQPVFAAIPLKSTSPPVTLELSYNLLTEPCENTFFDSRYSPASFDDHELPLHLLVYRCLLQLPVDVRSMCMSRIIFAGGCANVLGLQGRIFDEVSQIVRERCWDPVTGKVLEQKRGNLEQMKQKARARLAGSGPAGATAQPGAGEQDGVWHDAANIKPEVDPVDEQLKKRGDQLPQDQGELRAIESIGAWSGASIISHLKIAAVATVDRDLWQQQGAAGASKPGEVDPKMQQRQSLGAGGFMRGAGAGHNPWTLGTWGAY